MESPFPGMDPYLELPRLWPDVHAGLIAVIRVQLQTQITPAYIAQITPYIAVEQIEIASPRRGIVPDVGVYERYLPGATATTAVIDAPPLTGVAVMTEGLFVDYAMPPPETLVLIAIVFLLAGWVKGVVGMGLPTVAMGALALVLAPVQAAALLVIPSLVTNVWQFVAGPAKWRIVRRLASLMIFVCIGTALGIQFLTSGSSRWPSVALGTVLAIYAGIALFLPKLSIAAHSERLLSPVVGAVTGVLTGATGVFVVLAVPYLSALNLSKDDLIQALGLSFTVSTVALAVALGSSGSYPPGILLLSIAAVVPALAGMFIGQRMRDRIEPAAFRRWFFIAMLLVGSYMVVRGITTQ